jgi:hypothetical protein
VKDWGMFGMNKLHEGKNSKKFNATVNKVHEEMNSARKRVSTWNVNWQEFYSDVYCYDLQFLSTEDILCLEDKYESVYDLSRYKDDSKRFGQAIERVTIEDYYGEEYVCEFRKVDWLLSNGKLARAFEFYNNGSITYSQLKRKREIRDQSYDYYASYNVNDNELGLRIVNNEDDICFVNTDFRQYQYNNKSIIEDEEEIAVFESKDDFGSLEIKLNRSGKVYRKELVIADYRYIIEGSDVVAAFYKDECIDVDNDMMLMISYVIEQFDIGRLEDNQLFDYINTVKSKVINAIKLIKGDVPIDGLSRRLDIALSMISTKKIVSKEDKFVKKKKR